MQEPQEMWVWSLGWEDPLEEGMATYSSILAWRIPWTEEPGELQSMLSQRVGHDWSDLACLQTRTMPGLGEKKGYLGTFSVNGIYGQKIQVKKKHPETKTKTPKTYPLLPQVSCRSIVLNIIDHKWIGSFKKTKKLVTPKTSPTKSLLSFISRNFKVFSK